MVLEEGQLFRYMHCDYHTGCSLSCSLLGTGHVMVGLGQCNQAVTAFYLLLEEVHSLFGVRVGIHRDTMDSKFMPMFVEVRAVEGGVDCLGGLFDSS